MQVKILGPAERDLEDGYSFYESQSTGLGTYFLDSLYSDIDSLAFYGGIHAMSFGFYRSLSRRFPYAIYYRVVENSVIINAVLDCRRKPGRIREIR